MAQRERIRDQVKGPLDLEYVKQRVAQGWTLTALEWERGDGSQEETRPGAAPEEFAQDVPYGVRVAADCRHLEEDPMEVGILTLMMDLLIDDKPFSAVAGELNQGGYRTRSGSQWSPVTVFNMLPRLIEMGPRIFSTEEWELRKRKLLRPV